MILTCPKCTTRYLLGAQVLGPDGRRVKCSACEHIWFQEQQVEDMLADRPEVEPIPDSVKPLPEGSGLPVIPGDLPPARGRGRLAGVAAATILFAVLGAGLYQFRDGLVSGWPASYRLFSALGVSVNIPGDGLVFDMLKAERSGPDVRISGQVINLTDREMHVPYIRVALKNGEGQAAPASYGFTPPSAMIGPQENMKFEQTIPGAPADAAEISLGFSLAEMHAAAEADAAPAPKSDEAAGGNSPAPHQADQAHPHAGE